MSPNENAIGAVPDSPVIIVGGGYTGLAAAYELSLAGHQSIILESDSQLGGLAGTFEITLDSSTTVALEKFYHHWFTSDTHILNLVRELGLAAKIKPIESRTGLFYANSIFRLSSPWDLLSFPAIPVIDRIRTGLMAIYARRINNWLSLESQTAEEWIARYGGQRAFETIWKPLLRGKFGPEASNVSAVWFWNKLKLRGGSRNKKGREELIYLEGSFATLTRALTEELLRRAVVIHTASPVHEIVISNGEVQGVKTARGFISAARVLVTTPLPIFLRLTPELPPDFRDQCARIRYLGNVCVVLRLKHSLSSTYWLNVADPQFPFVGIIEHTNFESTEYFGGEHIAYLSKYLSTSDHLYQSEDNDIFEYCLPYLKRMFPAFEREWVIGVHVWKAPYSQPVITKNYSKNIPPRRTPVKGLWLSSMAQIYPEDRGTNYAIREGREVAREMNIGSKK